jgi:hypothetical protein
VVAFLLVAIKGVHWARDGPKFVCRVDGCNASYIAKYNLVQHLQARHNVTMELNMPRCPFTWEEGPRHQKHTTMNVWVLSNPLAQFHCNEYKAITRSKRHITLEWDRLQVDLQYTPKVPKSTLVKLTSSHILQLLCMIAWDVRAILLNV